MPLDVADIATGLVERSPGFFVSADHEEVSYPQLGHNTCLAVESTSFWFRHRAACVVEAVRRHPPGGPILDIGGGTGHMSAALGDAGFDIGLLEPGATGCEAAYGRGVRPVIQATLATGGIKPSSLDAVGLFDVLEHIEDDADFLDEIRTALKPHGSLYLTVPAYQWLWSVDDDRAGHHRRYTRDGLEAVLHRSGLSTAYSTYMFQLLPPAIFLARTLPSRFGSRSVETDATRDHASTEGFVGSSLRMLLDRERAAIAAGRRRAFGTSVLAVATNT